MKRRLFAILATMSLVMCIATCALWERSYWRCDRLQWVDHPSVQGNGRWVLFFAGNGKLLFWMDSDCNWSIPHRDRSKLLLDHHSSSFVMECYCRQVLSPNNPPPHQCHILGLFIRWGGVDSPNDPETREAVVCPLWIIFATTFFLPTIWLLKKLSRRGFRPSFCRKCGYDLRATPDRCPECGMATKVNV